MTCKERVQLLEGYKVQADERMENLSKQVAAQKEEKPNVWTIIGLSVVAGFAAGRL